jgi:hypothetical protein
MLNEEEERNKKKSLLKSYYNESTTTSTAKNPLDINSASFDCDLYLSQHIKVNHSFFFFSYFLSEFISLSLSLCLRRKS